MAKSWFIYIAKCSDSSLYTGITTNIEKRIETHNSGKGSKYARARLPVEAVYTEKFNNRSDASKREAEIKKLSRKEKQELVRNAH